MTRLRLRVRHQGRVVSLRGIDVETIEPYAVVSRVPGSPFGMALVRGQIVPVSRLGDVNGCLIVGRVGREIIGIAGLDVVGFDLEENDVEESTPGFPHGIKRIELWESMPPESNANNHLELDIAAIVEAAKLDKFGPALERIQ
ncbi:MAG TPA: hypothetical protein VIV60_30825 [Polyangiaceae bacterium]